jgi:hypothetical protein
VIETWAPRNKAARLRKSGRIRLKTASIFFSLTVVNVPGIVCWRAEAHTVKFLVFSFVCVCVCVCVCLVSLIHVIRRLTQFTDDEDIGGP